MNEELLREAINARKGYLERVKTNIASGDYKKANEEFGVVSCFVNQHMAEIKGYNHGGLFIARAEILDRALGDIVFGSRRIRSLEVETGRFEESFAQIQLAIQTDNTGHVK